VDLLGGFDEGVCRHNHENAIGENGDNDEEGEERMNENDDRHPPDGIERRQQPHGVRGAEPVNVFPFADHHKRLQCKTEHHTRIYILLEYNNLFQKLEMEYLIIYWSKR